MVRWRVGLQWYAVALLLPIVVTLAAAALNVFLLGALLLGGRSGWLVDPPRRSSSPTPHPRDRRLLEEPGFRSYALPRLQVGRSALGASEF